MIFPPSQELLTTSTREMIVLPRLTACALCLFAILTAAAISSRVARAQDVEAVAVDTEDKLQAEQAEGIADTTIASPVIEPAGSQDTPATALTSAQRSEVVIESWGDLGELPLRPIVTIGVGVAVVLSLMIGLKVHAFVALILGSIVISAMLPVEQVGMDDKNQPVFDNNEKATRIIGRVNTELGSSVAKIGILIAMAAIVGQCMLDSGAADRIVQTIIGILGAKRGALALMISAFLLGIPVFFDTVFFLLVPLARSLYRATGQNYVKYLMAVAAGGAITHTLVPPTPGPLIVVETIATATGTASDLGTVILLGIAIGLPASLTGLLLARFVDKRMPIEMRTVGGREEERVLHRLPSFPVAMLPVLLPVLLISLATILNLEAVGLKERLPNPAGSGFTERSPDWLRWVDMIGDPPVAMIIAALTAAMITVVVQRRTLRQLASELDTALLSAGVIILITAAGGAFGSLLRMSQIGSVVASAFSGGEVNGRWLLVAAYGLAAALKIAQGSSTVAMMITSSLVGPLIAGIGIANLGFSVAYFVPVIGAGSLLGSWMNDSGFWVYAKMGGLTEGETLRSWTVCLSTLSVTAFVTAVILSMVMPLA